MCGVTSDSFSCSEWRGLQGALGGTFPAAQAPPVAGQGHLPWGAAGPLSSCPPSPQAYIRTLPAGCFSFELDTGKKGHQPLNARGELPYLAGELIGSFGGGAGVEVNFV